MPISCNEIAPWHYEQMTLAIQSTNMRQVFCIKTIKSLCVWCSTVCDWEKSTFPGDSGLHILFSIKSFDGSEWLRFWNLSSTLLKLINICGNVLPLNDLSGNKIHTNIGIELDCPKLLRFKTLSLVLNFQNFINFRVIWLGWLNHFQ